LVTHRAFLNPVGVSAHVPNFPNRVVFIHGRLLDDRPPSAFFHELVERARVSPFFFVTDKKSVLLGALSSEGDSSTRTLADRMASVSSVVEANLERVVVIRDGFWGPGQAPMHRYQQLLGPLD
jgi:hypothetical protein